MGGSQKSAAAGEVHSYLLATYHLVPSLHLGRGRGRRTEREEKGERKEKIGRGKGGGEEQEREEIPTGNKYRF